MPERVAVDVDFEALGKAIQALDFDTVFTIQGSDVVRVDHIYAPSVTHDPDADIWIDGAEWECLTGMTGQYGYHGAVMHASEVIGSGIAELLTEYDPGTLFAIVIVDVLSDDCEDHEDHGDGNCEPAGWAIAYRDSV